MTKKPFFLDPKDGRWSIIINKPEKLHALFEKRRLWVAYHAGARLTENFVFLFQNRRSGFGQAKFLVEGIDGTAVVTIRALPISRLTGADVNPLNAVMDVYFFRQTPDDAGPYLASAHLQLGHNPTEIANFLHLACTNFAVFADNTSDNAIVHKRFYYVDNNVATLMDPQPTTCQFINTANPDVLFESSQADMEVPDSDMPEACNIDHGIGTVVDETLVTVDLTSVIVKAYP